MTDLNTDFFFDYKIFPSNILTFLAQWTYEKRKMQIGDTIVQQALIPPFRHFSQKIVFGVRINVIINEPTKNYGFRISLVNESIYRSLIFASSENKNPKLRPKLVVVYK